MSGVISGITKIFKPIASVATKVLLPIVGIGASLFTGGAAMGLPSLLAGGFSALTGLGGVFGQVSGVAAQRAGVGQSAEGGGLFSGLSGGAGPAVGSPAGGAMAASGLQAPMMDVGGAKSADTSPLTAQMLATPTGGNQFFKSLEGGGLLSGLGAGVNNWLAAKQQEDLLNRSLASRERMQDKEIGYLTDKEQRLRDSYSVGASAHQPQVRPRYRYDRESGAIVMGG